MHQILSSALLVIILLFGLRYMVFGAPRSRGARKNERVLKLGGFERILVLSRLFYDFGRRRGGR
jgi:hypothetical protein